MGLYGSDGIAWTTRPWVQAYIVVSHSKDRGASMGILNWFFGRRSPAITFTSFSMPVSPTATDTSHPKRENVGPLTAPAVPLAPEAPWPKWKNGIIALRFEILGGRSCTSSSGRDIRD